MTNAQEPPAHAGDQRWRAALRELRSQQQWTRRFARALGLRADSPQEEVLREYLLARLFSSALDDGKSASALLRELEAARSSANESGGRRKKAGPRGAQLKQHLDQLYGPGVVIEDEAGDAPEKTR